MDDPNAVHDSVLRKPHSIEYVNGQWFEGSGFTIGNRYVRDGLFVPFIRPDEDHVVIDLGGRFVVPPFGDAHSHHPEQHFSEANRAFIENGIFYVLNANDIPCYGNRARQFCFTAQTVDVLFAHAGFTCTRGHPSALYERLLTTGIYPDIHTALESVAYFEVDSPSDVRRKWLIHVGTKPDLIKVYILDLDDSDNPAGLSLESLTTVCQLATSHGLRVAAHIETADDFRRCVAAGVKLIMHLPGYRTLNGRTANDYLLSRADAEAAAANGVAVVTTAALLDKTRHPKLLEVQTANLHQLKVAQVRIGIGTDREPGYGIRRELEHLRSLDVFSDLELLKLLCLDTPHIIFPERRLGSLTEGHEASFVTLEDNPGENITATFSVGWRVKAGVPLSDMPSISRGGPARS